ncbi:spore gernimation protein [Paenibacillus selenitireducens]|uniref:Spore gernimation protein n=1 Tax=Paenibacillus selenitireducens TaxID=1324314 RepID=A0A1T2X0R8_9BACL|nr:endospore germination permease [Paenibacillus selenitireducens]OPA73316.1 spore gernimation protein [Paenibacillus selenitireducens]
MVMRKPITYLQVCFILSMSTGLLNHVTIIPLLLRETHKDGWISVLLALFLSICWIPLLLWIMGKKGTELLFPWLCRQGGKFTAWIITILLIAYLILAAFVTIQDTSTWTKISYLPSTPMLIIAATMVLLSLASALAGIQAIAICAGVFLPVVVVLGYFVMGANFQFKDYSLMLPMLENGISPVIRGLVFIGGGMTELIFVLLMQSHLSKKPGFWGMSILAVILAGLTIGPYLGSIANFGVVNASSMRYPAFEQWRIVTAGKYIEHLDVLSIYQWLSGSFIRISLMFFLMIDLLPLRSLNRRVVAGLVAAAIIILVVIVGKDDFFFVEMLHSFYFPSVTCGLILLSLLLALLAARHQRQS